MTEQNIYDDLDAVPSVLAIHVKDGRNFDHFAERIFQYITKNGDVGRAESFTVIVHDQGGPNEEYLWMNGKPAILQDNTTRELFLTKDQISDRIEASDVNKDVIMVGDIRIRTNNMDQTSVEYLLNDVVENNVYLIRKDEAPEWAQPAGKEDAPNTGDVVTHNSTLWRSLVKENQTEPVEGTNWTEITEDELIHVNPRSKV